MEAIKEKKDEEKRVCPICGEPLAKIVPTKENLKANPFLSEETAAYICFNYSCPGKSINFHKDKWWDWG